MVNVIFQRGIDLSIYLFVLIFSRIYTCNSVWRYTFFYLPQGFPIPSILDIRTLFIYISKFRQYNRLGRKRLIHFLQCFSNTILLGFRPYSFISKFRIPLFGDRPHSLASMFFSIQSSWDKYLIYYFSVFPIRHNRFEIN